MFPALPLARYSIAKSHSLEETAVIQTSFIGRRVNLALLDTDEPFAWTANRAAFDQIGIMASQYGAGVCARESEPGQSFHLVLSIVGTGRVRQGRHSVDLQPGRRAAICSPAVPIELSVESGYQGRVVAIPARLMDAALDGLSGFAARKPLQFRPEVDLAVGAGGAALRWLEFVVGELDRGPDALLASPLAQSRMTEVLLNTLLFGLANTSAGHSLAASLAAPTYVHRAEEYLDANAHRYVSPTELARVSGIGVRALGMAFKRYRGRSASQFARERRLELARERLLSSPTATVTEVALTYGFEHLGRFSIAYRARFGESPSATVRRRKFAGGLKTQSPTGR